MADDKYFQKCPHALLLPYPSQGHINPMLQFAKRLAHHGLRSTLAVTRSALGSTEPEVGVVHVATISDGFDKSVTEVSSVEDYLAQLKLVGSKTLEQLMETESTAGRPVHVVIYDTFMPWGADVARRFGAATAAFFTQSCAVDAVYGQVWEGKLEMPVRAGPVQLTGLPMLELGELPSLVLESGVYPAYVELLTKQFLDLDKADEVLINSFYELETEEADYMASVWRAKTIGPTVPSSYLDNLIPSDTSYGFHIFKPDTAPCMAWLDTKPENSVVYISIGSLSSLDPVQMAELAYGLFNSNIPFLWVVRSSEKNKLPEGFTDKAKERGLIITWSPQLDVLAHRAVGCFLTHCGWNSTVEALSLGVPMVAFPQWTDQPMNAKYVECVWEVGVRTQRNGAGLVSREEVERCVKEVMQGERCEEYRRNSQKWSNKAREAMKEGGSSFGNIVELVAKFSNN
ncbi:crocetin glucosyltransferase 2-like isoform X2 [Carex littledalei]|uniref:Glycosyltransferase n=1 Tax=Carex littledalei TaxID=544730 RepID=A0A833R9G2_9POAL|nr:crocetin glucosyltransferase 2-like isoform X2 [Carex littledalei]